jgi:putative transposase
MRFSSRNNSVGIDLGIKDFAILSEGIKIANPEIKKYNRKLERLHKNLSRKQKGSKNWYKAKIKLARSIASASWFKFYTFLNYKAEWLGKKILKIGRFVPSSKLCSVCGYKNKKLTLKDRTWMCPECGTEHDRDINAAVNIRNIGLNTAGTAGFQACGESVSLVFSKAVLVEAGSFHFKNR